MIIVGVLANLIMGKTSLGCLSINVRCLNWGHPCVLQEISLASGFFRTPYLSLSRSLIALPLHPSPCLTIPFLHFYHPSPPPTATTSSPIYTGDLILFFPYIGYDRCSPKKLVLLRLSLQAISPLYWLVFIDLHVLNNSCIPRIKPT